MTEKDIVRAEEKRERRERFKSIMGTLHLALITSVFLVPLAYQNYNTELNFFLKG